MRRTCQVLRNILLAAVAVVSCTCSGLGAEPDGVKQEPKLRATVGAYYFEGWAGRHPLADKEPWAKDMPVKVTRRMLDEFPDREPVWGWRDDSVETMERQIDLAADNGIAFFAFCWYWHDTAAAIQADPHNAGLELFLKAKNNKRIRFALLVANHAPFEIMGEKNWQKAAELWMPYLKHPQQLLLDGKPLLILFNASNADKAGFQCVQDAARKASLPGVAAAAAGFGPEDMYSYTTRYNVVSGWERGLERHAYAELVEDHKRSWKGTAAQPHIPCLSVGWDRRPWEEGPNAKQCWYYPDRTPEAFGKGVEEAIAWMDANPKEATKERLMLIYAWNELGEGGYMVPTKGDPDGKYLKALRAAVQPR